MPPVSLIYRSILGGPFPKINFPVRQVLLVLLISHTVMMVHAQTGRQKELIESGILKAKMGDLKAALRDLDEAVIWDTNEAEPYYNRGIVKSETGDYEGAIDDFTTVIRMKPAFAEPYYNRGLAKDYLNDHQGAILDYSRAINLKPDYPEAYHNLGLARFDLGNFSKAMEEFSRAIQYKPDFGEAYYNRGLCRFNLNDLEAALTDFNAALAFDSTDYEYYESRGATLAAMRNFDPAVADFMTAERLQPGRKDNGLNIALAYMYMARYEDAFSWYERMVTDFPDDAEAWTNRGVARHYLGEHAAACNDWKEAIRLGSDKALQYFRKFCE